MGPASQISIRHSIRRGVSKQPTRVQPLQKMQLRYSNSRVVFSLGPVRLAFSPARLLLVASLLAGALWYFFKADNAVRQRKDRGSLWRSAAKALAEFCAEDYVEKIRPQLEKDGDYVLATVTAYAPRGIKGDRRFFPNETGHASHGDHGGFKIWLYRNAAGVKDQVSRMLLQDGVWEKELSDFLLNSFLPDSKPFESVFDPTSTGYQLIDRIDGSTRAYLDIGCNLGYFTLLLASKGINVICVEPLPRNLGLLASSICENKWHPITEDLEESGTIAPGAVVIFPFGVGEPQSGNARCRMLIDTANIGNARFICGNKLSAAEKADAEVDEPAHPPFPNLEAALFSRDVQPDPPILTVDQILPAPRSLFPDGLKIHAMKLDIEGYEERALLGAKHWLSRKADRPRYLVTEVDPSLLKMASKGAPDDCCSADSYISTLKKLGYELYTVGKRGGWGGRFKRMKNKEHEEQAPDEASLNVFGQLVR